MTKPILKGVLKTWKEDRGFGFITPDNGGRDIFIHISAIYESGYRPVPGDIIHYQVIRDKNGKFRAINARVEGASEKSKFSLGADKSKLRWLWIASSIVITLVAIAGAVYVFSRVKGLNP